MQLSDLKNMLSQVETDASSASPLVGRLLTEAELDAVGGGSTYCMGSGHSQSDKSNYKQSGGTYGQTGGSYEMACPSPPNPI